MSAILTVFVFFGVCILVVALLILKAVSGRNEKQEPDEALLVQEMYRTLGRLEERLDVLETLIEDRFGKGR